MKKVIFTLFAFVAAISISAQTLVGEPDGFAKNGNVTGGAGGTVVVPTSTSELTTYLDSNDALIILINGTFDLGGSMHTLRSNKTIIGVGCTALITNGGFESGNKYNNVIIQNIEFTKCTDDLLKLYGAQKFWVDHCTFSDGPAVDEGVDGLFDITNAADYITISNCKFFNHSKNILIGAKDGNTADAITKVTLHHNWFKGTYQRNPRVRYASVHTYNNYYDGNTIYGLASACTAKVYVENNYFKGVAKPMHVGYDDSPAGYIKEVGNTFEGCGTPITNGETGKKGQPVTGYDHTWTPSTDYAYTAMPTAEVPAYVMANAGIFQCTSGVLSQGENGYGLKIDANPVSTSTNIEFSAIGNIKLSVVDITGKEVAVLYQANSADGLASSVTFNASGLQDGLYFAVLQSDTGVISEKIYVKKISTGALIFSQIK